MPPTSVSNVSPNDELSEAEEKASDCDRSIDGFTPRGGLALGYHLGCGGHCGALVQERDPLRAPGTIVNNDNRLNGNVGNPALAQ